MRLAIPKRIDISALGKLSSQHGRSGRLLIDAKLVERSPPLIEQVDLLYQLQIQPTEWRSLSRLYTFGSPLLAQHRSAVFPRRGGE